MKKTITEHARIQISMVNVFSYSTLSKIHWTKNKYLSLKKFAKWINIKLLSEDNK